MQPAGKGWIRGRCCLQTDLCHKSDSRNLFADEFCQLVRSFSTLPKLGNDAPHLNSPLARSLTAYLYTTMGMVSDAALTPLLRMAGPGCASLVTTRQRTVADELSNMLESKQIPVGELDEESALTLLMEICQDKLTDRGVLVPLARAADGLPLTLELMGAYINNQLPTALDPLQIRQALRRIENHLHLPGDAGPRRLSLKEVIDLSVNDLPDHQTKQAFFALGAFAPKPATFSEEAVQFVTGSNLDRLQYLCSRHLLDRSPSGRYTLHQSLASAAQEHLSSKDAAWSRHRDYYQKQIERAVMIRQGEVDALRNIDWRTLFNDLPQMRAIRLPQRPDPIFSILVNRLSNSMPGLRWLNALPIWLKKVLSRILLRGMVLSEKGAHVTGQKRVEATLANYQGWLYAEAGSRNCALSHYKRAYGLWTILRNRPRIAEVLNNLGKTCYMQADYRQAMKYYHRTLTIRRELNDQGGQAHILTNTGAVFDMINRVDWAIKSLRTALSLYQEVQDERGEAFTLLILGTCYHGLGEREKMLAYLELALAKHTSARNEIGCARTLMELGLVYLDFEPLAGQEQEQDTLETAMRYFQRALELQVKFGDLAWQGRTRSRMGQVYAKKGEIAKALDEYIQALSIHQHVGYRAGLSTTLSLISDLFHEAGKDIWAQAIANEGKSEHADIGLTFKQKLKS